MKIQCRTNIDCCKTLSWPSELPARPMIGDYIRSESKLRNNTLVEMVITNVTWIKESGGWMAEVYLDMPKHRYHNFNHFEAFVMYATYQIDEQTYQRRVEQSIPS